MCTLSAACIAVPSAVCRSKRQPTSCIKIRWRKGKNWSFGYHGRWKYEFFFKLIRKGGKWKYFSMRFPTKHFIFLVVIHLFSMHLQLKKKQKTFSSCPFSSSVELQELHQGSAYNYALFVYPEDPRMCLLRSVHLGLGLKQLALCSDIRYCLW